MPSSMMALSSVDNAFCLASNSVLICWLATAQWAASAVAVSAVLGGCLDACCTVLLREEPIV